MAWRLVVGVLGAAALSAVIVYVIFSPGSGQKSVKVTPAPSAAQSAKGLHFPGGTANAPKWVIYRMDNVLGFLATGDLDAEAIAMERNNSPSKGDLNLIQRLAAIPQVQAGSYEVRALSYLWGHSPSGGIWLKSATGGTDLIYPNLTFPEQYTNAGLKEGVLYTLPDYLSALQTAEKRIEAEIAAQNAANAAKQAADATRKAAIIVENQRKAANGEDTATTRLDGLQAAMEAALTDLKQARAGFFDQTMADIRRVQVEVAAGLEYIKAHPESDRLTPRPFDGTGMAWSPTGPGFVPFFLGTPGPDFSPRVMAKGPPPLRGGGRGTAPSVPVAAEALILGLINFLGNQSLGQPLVTEMGGNRDLIMRDVAVATNDFIEATDNLLNAITPGSVPPPGPQAAATPAGVSAHPGSISGTVVAQTPGNPAGSPAASAMVAFAAVPTIDWGALPSGTQRLPRSLPAGSIPGAIADASGAFAIKNVPPGFYVLCAGANWIVVEVKADTETILPMPLDVAPPIVQSGQRMSRVGAG